MITTCEDEYAGIGDDMIKVAEEAFEYLIRASGVVLKVFCLKVTDVEIERAKTRLASISDLEAELNARLVSDMDAREQQYMAAKVSWADIVKKEAVQPEAVQPEAVQPEAVQPEAVQPEAVQPEAVM